MLKGELLPWDGEGERVSDWRIKFWGRDEEILKEKVSELWRTEIYLTPLKYIPLLITDFVPTSSTSAYYP